MKSLGRQVGGPKLGGDTVLRCRAGPWGQQQGASFSAGNRI